MVTAILSLTGGERPALPALGGALLLLTGVVIVTRTHSGQGRKTLAGVPEALGAALCYGMVFRALDFVTPVLGPFWPLLIFRITILSGALLTLTLANRGRASQTSASQNPSPLLPGSAVHAM